MKIYIDSDYKCHTSDDGTRREVETDFFNNKCRVFIEGYKYDDSRGYAAIYPWRDYTQLAEAQAAYDEALALSQETISDMQTALNTLGVN